MNKLFNKQIIATLLIATVALFAQACDKEPNVAKIPGAEEYVCSAGDTIDLTFTAGDKWSLSSNQKWCQFVTYAGMMQDTSGGAGVHTVKIAISDENPSKNVDEAKITIKIGSASGIIATVKRNPSQYYMKILDITDTKRDVVRLQYVDWCENRIEANFRFAAIDWPEWVEFAVRNDENKIVPTTSITGGADDQTVFYARIVNNNDRERKPITSGDGYTITFTDEAQEQTFSFPIVYDGMGVDNIAFVGPSEQVYGWKVSLDGTTFTQTNNVTGQTMTFSNSLDFDIIAHEGNFAVIYLEQNIDRGISSYSYLNMQTSGDKHWLHFDKENHSLTVDQSKTTRYGMVMILPMGVYNKIRADIPKYIFETDSASGIELPIIASDYQKYIVIELTQCDINEQNPYAGMYVYHSITTLDIPAEAYTDSTIMAQYGASEAYVCPFVNSVANKKPGIVIDPRIEQWTTAAFEEGTATAEVYHNGEKLKMSDDEYYLGENKDEKMALYLWGPKNGWQDENVYIVFKVNEEVKKLLVVTPPAK